MGRKPATTSLTLSADDLDDLAPVMMGSKPKPKRAMPAFQFFAADQRKMMKDAGEKTSTETMKKIGAAWNKISSKDKDKYEKMAVADKKRYEKDAVGYVPPPKPTKSGKRLAKDPERPKKAKTAYLFYADQARPSISKANPGLSVTSIAPLLAAGWKKLSDSQRAKFTSLAEKDKGRFAKEMESYEPSEAYVAAREQFNALQKAQKAAKLSKVPAGAANPGEFTSLQEENAKLRAALEQERRKSSEHIKLLQAFHAKEAEKGDKEAEELAYSKFVKKAWGDMGEKADKALKIVYAEHGHQGVVEELATRFREKELPKVKAKLEVLAKKRNKEAAKLDLAASASAVDAEGAPVKRGRGRPIGAKSKPKEPGSTPKKAAKPAAKKKATSPAPSEPRSKRAKK